MKLKRNFNPLRIGKGLLCLLALFVMLLSPQRAWAEDEVEEYVFVSGSNITSANYQNGLFNGKVTFTPATQNSRMKLTLNGFDKTLGDGTGRITISGQHDLEIELVGDNTVWLINSQNTANKLSFSGNGTLTLDGTEKVVMNIDEIDLGDFNLASSSVGGVHVSNGNFYDVNNKLASNVILTTAAVYPLWVAGVQVTGDNASNITGDFINEGTVSYTPAQGSTPATLTLNGAEIQGEIVSVKDEDLTILVVGNSRIITAGYPVFQGKANGTNNNLRLTYNGSGEGVSLRVDGLSSPDEMASNWKSTTKIWKNESDFSENEEGLNPDLCDWHTTDKCDFFKIGPNKKYDIWIGGIQITESHDSSDGVSFDSWYNRLVLNDATIAAPGIAYSGTEDLTIRLYGTSSVLSTSNSAIRYTGPGTSTPKLTFAPDPNDYPCSLALSSGTNTVISAGFSSVDGVNGIGGTSDAGLVTSSDNSLVYGENGLYTTGENTNPVTTLTIGTPSATYDLKVGGVVINSDNYRNISSDEGQVSFDPTNNTLTLNNVVIDMTGKSGYPIESGYDYLTVKLVGNSVLIPNATSTSGIYYSGTNTVTHYVSLSTDELSYGSLKVDGVTEIVSAFGNYTLHEDIVTSGDGWRTIVESGDNASLTFEFIKIYDAITVAGIEVTNKNAANIQGDDITKGTVSYIPAQGYTPATLTLNGAEISGSVVWNSEYDIDVVFNGENSIVGGDNYAIQSTQLQTTNQYINFIKASGATNVKLTLSTKKENESPIIGFNNVIHYDLFLIDESNETQCITTILSNLFASGNGTESDPFLIKTPQDLKNFATYFNDGTLSSPTCVKLNDNINCEELEGFEPIGTDDYPFNGTFNGNNKIISNLSCSSGMSYVGLFGQIGNGYDASGSVSNLTLKDCTFTGTGISCGAVVGKLVSGTVSDCKVTGQTKLNGVVEEGAVYAGAIVGLMTDGTLTNNTYEYTVTTSTKVGNNDVVAKNGYTQRAFGAVYSDADGAVMYTQTVMLPEGTEEASVMAEEGTYYSTTVVADVLGLLVAPGQTVTLNATPGDGYVITSLTATNTTTEATISTSSEELGDNITKYTFEMPDAPVTVALTTAETIGLRVAGVEVTELNKTDILGDGKVSFTPAVPATETTPAVPATLTLNGATINGGVYSKLEGAMTVHLLGLNTIDGGYESQDENGEYAFKSGAEAATLTFITNDATPGQLLLKNQYRNANGYAQYYYGFQARDYQNGLVEGYSSDEKHLIARGPVVTPASGIYWPDQTYTITGNGNGIIKYSDGKNHFSETTYEDPFTMATVGKYLLSVTQTISCDESSFILGNGGDVYIVHNKPGFSVEAGTCVGTQNITLTNLPTNLSANITSYPQVWYYLGNNEQDSIQYTSAEQEIAVTESTKVCVYILDEDTGKVVKSKPVEAEYTILSDIANVVVTGLADTEYTGNAIVPEFTVKASADAESSLVKGTDYEVSYKQGETPVESMIDVATYTIVISGKGSYGGTKEVAFNITQATPTITFAQESYSAILGEEFISPATVDNWEVTPWSSSNEDVATVADGVITINGVGTTTITVFFAGDQNYLSETASYQLVVSRALEVTFVGTNSWASYYATENLAVPEGLTAYVVSEVNETSGVVTVQSVGYIPANNGVLLQREEGGDADGYVAAPYTGTTATITNLLGGSTSATAVSSLGNPVYVLYNDKFKRATSGTIPAGRAYLALGAAVAPAQAPQFMTLNVVDGNSTGIGTLAADDNDGSWYTIDGLKLAGKPQHKGLYIKKGQKVFFNNK